MRYWKKNLVYLMLILIFTLSFSKDENKITIFEKNNEPAKLKIGVTKIKTEEVPMEYHVEQKLVYCELPKEVGENDVIYVSETLDEIPSISTTSGRRTINNINKYLTKDIKANSKFNYRIVVKKDEKTEEEKKYIVIHCKEPATNIYLYVVEKGTYRMKKLYRGKFNLPSAYSDEQAEYVKYDTIKFYKTHDLQTNDIITSDGNGDHVVIKRGATTITPSSSGTNKVVDPLLVKGFAKKYAPGSMNYWRSKVIIKLGTGVSVETSEKEFAFKDGIFDLEMPINTIDANVRAVRERMRIYTEKSSDFINIKLLNWDSNFSALNLPITIEYWYQDLPSDDFKLKKMDSFELVVETKQAIQDMGINKISSIDIKPTEYLHRASNILVYDGKKAYLTQNGTVIKDSSKYINIRKGYLTKYNWEPYFNQFKDVRLQIIQNGKIIKENIMVQPNGEFSSAFELYGIKYGGKIGVLRIFSDKTSENLKYEIRVDVPYRDTTINEIQLRYHDSNNNIIKSDSLNFNIAHYEEELLDENSGGIYVTNPSGLNFAVITALTGGTEIKVVDDYDEERFKESNGRILGNFPEKLANINDDKHDWGEEQRIAITNESENNGTSYFNLAGDGTFTTPFDKKDALIISSEEDHSSAGGLHPDTKIGIKATKNNKYLEISIFDYNDAARTVLNKTLKLEYQIRIGNEWITKKTDRLKIIIQPKNMTGNTPDIKIHNPIVWYDYSSSSAVSNINHYRKAELLFSDATTLNPNGTEFKKNKDLNGRPWIEVKNIPEYTWWCRHKIEINTGRGEVVKYTDSNGKTKSSTFVNLSSRGSGANRVMIAYDGKDKSDTTGSSDKSLSFGISDYNFNGGSGKIIISQYDGAGNLEKVEEYSIDIDKFSGIHYVDSQYDIKPKQDYTKKYEFNKEIDIKPIDMNYGTVGFRDLDTRITNQSGGEGIEFRLTQDVTLIGQGEFSGYEIDAILEFEGESSPSNIYSEQVAGERYWIFKGKTEDSTSAKIRLKIPSQEYLIPETRFKIVERKNKTKSPLRVGVVVKNDKEKFFEEVADLYLNMLTKRFVKTEIIFENPSIQENASTNSTTDNSMKWIKLNESNYPKGKIEGYNGANWGSIRGEIIDIPIDKGDLTIKVFDENYKEYPINNLVDNIFDIKIGDINPNILQIKYDKGTNYLSFRVNNSTVPYQFGKVGKFYLRFEAKDSNSITKYLFTQEYIVSFNKEAGFIGNTIVTIKNPMMSIDNNKYNIYVDKRENIAGKVKENGNHNTIQDSQKWWEVEAPINYPKLDKHIYKLYSDDKFTNEIIDLADINLEFVDENPTNKYSTLKVGIDDLNFDGSEKRREIFVKWTERNPDPSGVVWERKDRIEVVRQKFDPTYYGKIFPTNGIDDKGENNYKTVCNVGDGFENLVKNSTQATYQIDLGTTYRDYQRYMGVLEKFGINSDFVVRGVLDKIVARSNTGKEIVGKIVFKEENQLATEYTNEVIVKPNPNNTTLLEEPKKYKLYFEVTDEEYKKLDYNTKYNLFVGENKDIIEIGYKNRTDSMGCKKLNLDKNLNFTISKQPFIITTHVLDFGTINIYFNDGTPIKKHGKTLITLSGEDIKNITLTLDKNNLIENGKPITYIKRYDENGVDQNIKLKVENIQLLEQTNQPVKQEVKVTDIKVYTLDGDLTVPLDSKVGNYIGSIYIDSTIIN